MQVTFHINSFAGNVFAADEDADEKKGTKRSLSLHEKTRIHQSRFARRRDGHSYTTICISLKKNNNIYIINCFHIFVRTFYNTIFTLSKRSIFHVLYSSRPTALLLITIGIQ